MTCIRHPSHTKTDRIDVVSEKTTNSQNVPRPVANDEGIGHRYKARHTYAGVLSVRPQAKMRAWKHNVRYNGVKGSRKMQIHMVDNETWSIRCYIGSGNEKKGTRCAPKETLEIRVYFQKSRLATTSSPFSSS